MIKILSLKSTQNQTRPLSVILKKVEVGGDNFLSDVKHDFQKNINVAYEIDHRFSSPGVPFQVSPPPSWQTRCHVLGGKKLRKLTHVASGCTKWRLGTKVCHQVVNHMQRLLWFWLLVMVGEKGHQNKCNVVGKVQTGEW